MFFLLAVCFFSCQKKDIPLTINEALQQQKINYEFQDRQYELTDLEFSDWPNYVAMIPDSSFNEISSEQIVFRRKFQVAVPEDQAGDYHIESMAWELAIVVDQSLIDIPNDRFLSNEVFRDLFLAEGNFTDDNRIAKISYHQTYWIAQFMIPEYDSHFEITEVESIAGTGNAFRISGVFSTDWGDNYSLSNGTFNMIIEN